MYCTRQILKTIHYRTKCLPLIEQSKPSQQQLAVELKQLEQLDVDVLINDCKSYSMNGRASMQHDERVLLFSTLTLAVSILPFSTSIAMSRRETFACADFFSWRVRNRCTPNLYTKDYPVSIPARRANDKHYIYLSCTYRRECTEFDYHLI